MMAMDDEQKRDYFYKKFAVVAEKYLGLQYDRKSDYVAIIALSPSDLVREGQILEHCVGRMNYDQKFVREESLIFFIRTKEAPNTPLVTVEYSPSRKKILQCYGKNDNILEFVNKKWQFSADLIRRGFDIIEVSDDTQFLDGNIERLTEPKQDKLILRACSMGEPSRIIQKVGSEERNAIQVNDKVYIP